MQHLRELEVYVQVYRRRSFSAAAIALNATQSGVSQTIKKLETTTGLTLFVRGTNTITPTSAGDRLYEQCSAFLEEHRSLIEDLRARSSETRPMKVGVNSWMTRGAIASVINAFSTSFPNVSLSVLEAPSASLFAMADGGQLDLAAFWSETSGGRHKPFLQTRGVLVSGAKCGVTEVTRSVKLIVPTEGDPNRQILDRYLARRHLNVVAQMEWDSLSASLAVLEESDWRMILPSVVFNSEPEWSRHRFVKQCLPNAPFFGLATVLSKTRSPHVVALDRLIREKLEALAKHEF